MPKYDLEEIIQKMQKDYAKYGGLADTLAKLDPFSERFKQTETAALKMVQMQKDYAKYGGLADNLAKLDPLSERFKQTEIAALKMVQMQKDYAKYGGLADTLSQLDPLSDFFKKMESIALQINDSWMKHQSITMKSMREMQDSPAAKMIREMQNSPFMKIIEEMQTFTHSKEEYVEITEENTSISDEAIGTQNLQLNEQPNAESLFINTVCIAISVLLINAEVPFNQLIVTLAQNFLNSALFFYLQSKYEISRKCPNSINKSDLRSSRITIKDESLYLEPKINSEIIENLEPYKFLRILEEPDLHKSWLKVQVEINNEILVGYVLRRYTSPIK